ncbi:tail fiber assembly protein [Atlantibacter hermannii]|uniref:tail fiber assembly protein n=1 Tax=Atlantibacter hermannii TaxID=565 RepID=UPI00289D87A1|nr:tail fiber assembly protein [Atlantibacter hermannii]
MDNCYAVVKDGIVINIVAWDGETEWQPDDGFAAQTDGSVGIGWLYDGETFTQPPIEPPSQAQLVAAAEQEKQYRLTVANNQIAPLQDAVDLDMATDEEVRLLSEWKKYRVLVNRVDTNKSPAIQWPPQPQ